MTGATVTPTPTHKAGSKIDLRTGTTIPPTVAPDKYKQEEKLRPIVVKAPLLEPLATTKLQFSPYAWAKLKFMCASVSTEIGGMAISDLEDPLLIVDIAIPKQVVNAAYVRFDDTAYADLMFELCDPDGEYKFQPVQCQRIWIHTHPGTSPYPSGVDEATFARTWGACDWAVMFILAKGGEFYARLEERHQNGLCTVHKLDALVRWELPFPAADHEAWATTIRANVQESYFMAYDYGARNPLWAQGVDAVRRPKSYAPAATPGTQAQGTGYRGGYDGRGYDGYYEGDDWFMREYGYAPPPPAGAPLPKTPEEKRFDHEANRDDPVGFRVLQAPKGWFPKVSAIMQAGRAKLTLFEFRYHDLLYYLDSYAQNILANNVKAKDLTHAIRQNLEENDIKITGEDVNGDVIVSYTDKDSKVSYTGHPKGLLRFGEYVGDKVRFDVEDDLKVAEAVLKRVAEFRNPLMSDLVTYTDTAGNPVDSLYPWVLMDGTTVIWLTTAEIEMLSDVRSGHLSAARLEYDLWQYSQEVAVENKQAERDQLSDEDQCLLETFEFAMAVTEGNRINENMFDVTKVENGFANLLKGAKTGGWGDVCVKVLNAFRRHGYDCHKAAADLNIVLQDPDQEKTRELAQVQPTVDEANTALKREE
jgi:proteasome lid subunit RPN8/RPN11